MELKKAFGYLRVSGKGQLDGDGFTRQREAITTWAAANDVTVTQWFEERGVSGTKDLEDRPALQELILALHSNGVKVVIIEKLDRFARDLMVQETIIGDMRKSGFDVISVAEPDLCSDDPSRTLVRQMFGAIAQYEKTMLVIKLRGARRRKRIATGHCEGRKPFGALDGEQVILDRMLNSHAFGSNFEQIARELNTAGALSRSGKPWRPATIRRIILAR